MMAQRVLFSGDSSSNEQAGNKRKKELDREEERMKMRYGENRRRDKGVPQACDCGEEIHVATSTDPNTRGKLYFCCHYDISDGPGKGCGFMRWWIPALLDEFDKIKEEKNELKKELDAAKKQIEEHDLTIFQMQLDWDALERDKQKEKKSNQGEQFDSGIVSHLMDRIEDLEKKWEDPYL